MTYFLEKKGCRTVTIVSSVLTAASFLSSFFISNIYLLYFTIGLLAGIEDTILCI